MGERTRRVVTLLLAFAGATGCQRLSDAASPTTTPTKPAAAKAAAAGLGLTATGDAITAIELLQPADAYATPTPLIRWTLVEGTAAYELALDDSEECTSPLQTYTTQSTTQVAQYLPNGVYFACVVARDGTGAVLARGSGRFWILAHDVADARGQNGSGGSGSATTTTELAAMPLFQDDWTTKQANREGGSVRRDGIASAGNFGIYADPYAGSRLRLVVNDRGNRRVLVFDGVPTRAGDVPAVVIGQADFDSGRANAGEHTSNLGFGENVHASVCTDGKLLVTDRANNRVLVWRHIPTENGAPADFVLGQSTFAGGAAGGGDRGLNHPGAAYCIGSKLAIIDRGNNRIVVFSSIPAHNGAAADYAIGQADLDATDSGCDAAHLNAPAELLVDGGRLYVADRGNNRVVAYTAFPAASGARAVTVLGQSSLAACAANRGGPVSAATLAQPSGLASRTGLLAVADQKNQRILFYTLPLTTGQSASNLLGQSDAGSNHHADIPEMGTFDQPQSLLFDGNFLWVGDNANKRLAVVPLPL